MTVHWSPGGTLPARPAAVAVVLGALALACAASFSVTVGEGGRIATPPAGPGVHSIMPVTDRVPAEIIRWRKLSAGPVRPP